VRYAERLPLRQALEAQLADLLRQQAAADACDDVLANLEFADLPPPDGDAEALEATMARQSTAISSQQVSRLSGKGARGIGALFAQVRPRHTLDRAL
jgi:hypothetical protein